MNNDNSHPYKKIFDNEGKDELSEVEYENGDDIGTSHNRIAQNKFRGWLTREHSITPANEEGSDNENEKEKSKTVAGISNNINLVWIGFKKFLGFVGPGYVIAVGYFDPGNWATDLAGGSNFGYSPLFIILLSNIFAMVLQCLAIKLGTVTGMDLAQACRIFFPSYIRYFLYILCELAIIATDLAEVIGSAIALNILFNIPLPLGIAITACDVMIILLIYRENDLKSSRILESLVMVLVSVIGACFIVELFLSKPVTSLVFLGYLPNSELFTDSKELFITVGIIGATVMPHNLYLHSHLIKVRKYREESKILNDIDNNLEANQVESDQRVHSVKMMIKKITYRTIKLSSLDSSVALTFALFINSAILIVAATNFYYSNNGTSARVAGLFDAYNLLTKYLGWSAGIIFALALLISGQSATLTATVAGQVVMEGFLGWTIPSWIRRLLTRAVAITPAMLIAILNGQNGLTDMLVASQVALCVQLPFAMIPLVYFTSAKKCMTVDVSNAFSPRSERDGESEGGRVVLLTPLIPSGSNDNKLSQIPSDEKYLLEFTNPIWLTITSSTVCFIIVCLDIFMLFSAIQGKTQ
ncbi:natural resistance-associated macrophage protein [Gigaspora rosea]|uniref:Natural resistance-associated macrophage protein n=1 Tax=Gigaspora rosea TaxID=44941 RepID=A0A397V5H5_9GLOM|nr:natural resistance-associated macrophage protein [Gigaspora rosea]